MTLQAGQRFFLCYEDDPGYWCERMVLAHVEGSRYVCASPDFDIEVELVAAANPDLRFPPRMAGSDGAAPRGIPQAGQRLWRFEALQPGEQRQLSEEGRMIAEQDRRERGLGGLGARVPAVLGAVVAPLPPVVAPIPPAPSVIPGAGIGGLAPVAATAAIPRVAPAAGCWLLDEPPVNHDIGTILLPPDGLVPLGSRALTMLDNEPVAMRFLPEGTDLDEYTNARKAFLSDDVRIAAPWGSKPLTLVSAVEGMSTVARTGLPPSPLEGPPTASNWLDGIVAGGHTSLVHRDGEWRSQSGVNAKSQIAHEHSILSRALHLGDD